MGSSGAKWRRAVVGAVAVVSALLVLGLVIDAVRNRAEDATWHVDPAAKLGPESTAIPLLVMESACASGMPAGDRVVQRVSYAASAVTIDIRVKPLGGAQRCQAVLSPYTVQLREPLGDRKLVDANARTP
jgi:hypothetical protein